jgi:hypothetical protein
MVSIALLVVIIVLAVLGIRKVAGREGAAVSEGHAVRRFFQYLLLLGLLVVVALGLSGLLGRLLDQRPIAADDTELARSLAFTVVGLPLYAAVALWSRRSLAQDPTEARSFGWAFYATAACLTSLGVAMFALHDVLAWATGLGAADGRALARLIVWGAVWGAHWWLHLRRVPPEHSHVHHLIGSLMGLGTSATGLAVLVAGAIEPLLGISADDLLAGGDNRLLRGAVTLAVGAPVWVVYWVLTASRQQRDPLWLGYVLLAGVGGGLVTAVVSASTVLYTVTVWLVGEPRSPDASIHFQGVPTAAGAAVAGLLLWWYHQAVLAESPVEVGPQARTEVRRVYEYLMAAIGLLAAAAGLTVVVVAAIESVTAATAQIAGASAVNTLLAAGTLLVVGGPVWWFFWHRIQAAARTSPEQEHTSPTRRIYLFGLFGVGGVAAVVALLVGVYLLFEDVVAGTAGAATVSSMRYTGRNGRPSRSPPSVALATCCWSGPLTRRSPARSPASRAAGSSPGAGPTPLQARGPWRTSWPWSAAPPRTSSSCSPRPTASTPSLCTVASRRPGDVPVTPR